MDDSDERKIGLNEQKEPRFIRVLPSSAHFCTRSADFSAHPIRIMVFRNEKSILLHSFSSSGRKNSRECRRFQVFFGLYLVLHFF